MSRHNMLQWMNNSVEAKHKKIEELCSGVAYCQFMESMFPRCIGIKRIKTNAKLEHEFMHNLKLLQLAFTRLNINKVVPIEGLLKGRFQDNFEFLQWFKKFYDTHSTSKENLKQQLQLPQSNDLEKSTTPPKSTSADELEVSPSCLLELQQSRMRLEEQTRSLEKDRDFFSQKLRCIELLLIREIGEHNDDKFSQKLLKCLYKSDDDTDAVAGLAEEAVNDENGDF